LEKNGTLKQKSIETVNYLIKTLEGNNFKPVIARNYENYPNFGNDLDLFISGDYKNINLTFSKVAEDLNWDVLTICTHYSNFKNPIFNIITYRFHLLDPMQTLNVDLFGGFALWGMPLIDRHEICKNRILEPNNRFYIMDQNWENGYRIFQIASLNPIKSRNKINRYTSRVLNFQLKHPKSLESWGRNCSLGDLSKAIKALKTSDTLKLKKTIMRAKLILVFNCLLKEPIQTITNLIDRAKGLDIQFNKNPCGPNLRFKGKSKKLIKKLNKLVDNQILPGWSETEDFRERGWAKISFEKKIINEIDEEMYKEIDFFEIVSLIINRHKTIYSKNKF